MAAIKIFWTQTAIRQRALIYEYWNNRNKSYTYSKKLNTEIWERLNTLKQNPDIGKPTQIKDVRAISLGHYSIFYQYNSTQIIILSFWDNRQEPAKLLNLLKK